ncbi:MAG: SAM-dependent chlorinase/fluorinase, partial [Anaerolineales bacterium]|nr:SAM-dependent chlorinase/fluorinase [Anaerolineales bacterium]
ARPYFPPETTFLGVVDPGVGTRRRALFLRTGQQNFIGPDNGLFTYLLQSDDFQAWALENPELALTHSSNTFQGRDLFAPAAAHAALGIPGAHFGNSVSAPLQFELPTLTYQSPGIWQGQVLHADHFGNLLTSFGQFMPGMQAGFTYQPWLGPTAATACLLEEASLQLPGGNWLRYTSTFADIPAGECAFLLGSTGLLEICANRQSAANLLNLSPGDPLTLMTKK